MRRRPVLAALALVLAAPALLLAAALLLDRAPPLHERPAAAPASAVQLERGRVLALAGHCAGCHTTPGGVPYAGPRAVDTPFGTAWAGNLTPDPDTGLGRWSAAQFWRALHHGRGADGRRLVPAFPYTEMTRLTREDSDALFAWLGTLPPVRQARPAHDLRWPTGTQPALALWRLLFFEPGSWQPDPARSAAWNRGGYLVNGVAHCAACHGTRNAWGGGSGGRLGAAALGGALLPAGRGYAPALTRPGEAGVAHWPAAEVVALLRDGVAPHGRASGAMAEVVAGSLQHLPEADLQAMAEYLRALPQQADRPPAPLRDPEAAQALARVGAGLYREHCAACHGAQGEGGVLADGPRAGQPAVPALAGNRLVTQEPPVNLVQAIARGGFGAASAGNPRPFGMPPFAHVLSDAEIAAVATHLRLSWGHAAAPLSAPEVARWRSP